MCADWTMLEVEVQILRSVREAVESLSASAKALNDIGAPELVSYNAQPAFKQVVLRCKSIFWV